MLVPASLIKFVTNRQLTYVGQCMLVLHVTVRVELLISITNCISLSRSGDICGLGSEPSEFAASHEAATPANIHQFTQQTGLHSFSKLTNI
jgi:hypothetical protein